MWSNERRHDLLFPDLKDLGGGYLGVGGDQNYTLAAAANSEVLWLIDLDSAVVHMHRLYAALLKNSPTIKDFLAQFDSRSVKSVHDAVVQSYPDAAEQKEVLKIYHAYRDLLRDHLHSSSHARTGSTWLADPQKYAYMRDLAQRGRILARLGDLTGPSTMLEIADAAQRGGIKVRAIYFSNAESWFRYGNEFRRNITALPFDDKSVVLRTVKSSLLSYPPGDIWHYTIQKAQHFSENLAAPAYRSIDIAMLDAALSPGPLHKPKPGLSHIGFPPAPGAKPLFVAQGERKRDERRALLAAGLVTRPEGNRECASEMDKDRLKRAALELARSDGK